MKRLFKVLVLSIISISFVCISCKVAADSDVPGGKPKGETSYSVFVTHLLVEDGNTFTKDNVIVTAFYDDGSSATVTDFTIEPDSFEVAVGDGEEFTFKRGEDTQTYKAFKASQTTHDSPIQTYSYSGSWGGEATYVEFGDYASTKLDDTTGMTFTDSPARNGWYIGSDGNYYGKVDDDYYSLEPIIWRLADDDYEGSGNALLIAETILEGGIPYYYDAAESYDVKKGGAPATPEEAIEKAKEKDSKIRYLSGTAPIFTNNYEFSVVRAFLNGYDYFDLDEKTVSDYKTMGFLQRAFSSKAQSLIVTTAQKNDRKSSMDPRYYGFSGDYDNPGSNIDAIDAKSSAKLDLTCGDTNDKVFILSEWQSISYLSETGNGNENNDQRKRPVSEYSAAKGSIANEYMTRTPYYKNGCNIRIVGLLDGAIQTYNNESVISPTLGIVPAIVVSEVN